MRLPVLFLAVSALTVSAASPAAAGGLGSLFSCDAQGSADTTGAVVGGLVGALAGSQVAGKKDRLLGAAIGAGLGAALGNNIGCRMDRKAQQDARQAFQRALDTGRPQTWSDPQTGATGRIEILGASTGPAPRGAAPAGRWRFAEGVALAQRVSGAGGTYEAVTRTIVRTAPTPSAATVDRLQAGERVEVAGTVAGGWLAVTEDGLIQGYVAGSGLRPVSGGYGGSGSGYGSSRYASGAYGGDCKLVQQTVTEPGAAPVRERYNACRDDRGEWTLDAA